MEDLLECTRRVLERHPSPALPYTELHRLVSLERSGPAPDPEHLLRRIRTSPTAFRTVEPWRGPWRPLTARDGDDAREYRKALAEAGLPVDVWIVARSRRAGGRSSDPLDSAVARLRITLVELSREVDGGSARCLARWILLIREARAARKRLRRSFVRVRA